jgi:hypothetical protein
MNSKTTSPSKLAVLILILSLAACGGAGTHSNSSPPGTTYPFVVEVTLQPLSAPSIPVAGTVQVAASAGYQVSSNEVDYNPVTTTAVWSSSDAAVATVNTGLVTGTGIGSATITASFEGKTGQTLVIVGQTTTLDITATGTGGFSLSAHPDQQFKASASYSDGNVLDLTSYATWNSSPAGILAFYDPYDFTHNIGEAKLLATGTTTVTAALETGEVGSLDVTVVP